MPPRRSARRAPRAVVVVSALVLAACASQPPSAAPAVEATKVETRRESPARWLPRFGASMGPKVAGGRLVLLSGRRAIVADDGAVRFEAGASNLRQVFAVPTRDGPRLVGISNGEVVAFDEPLGPLTWLAPVHDKLAIGPGLVMPMFWDRRMVIDLAGGPTRSPFAAFPVPIDVGFTSMDDGLALFAGVGLFRTHDGGKTFARGEPTASIDREEPRLEPTAPRLLRWIEATGEDPRVAAIEGGVLVGPREAIVARWGVVARVDLETAEVRDLAPIAGGGCLALEKIGRTVWISCRVEHGTVARFFTVDAGKPSLEPRPVAPPTDVTFLNPLTRSSDGAFGITASREPPGGGPTTYEVLRARDGKLDPEAIALPALMLSGEWTLLTRGALAAPRHDVAGVALFDRGEMRLLPEVKVDGAERIWVAGPVDEPRADELAFVVKDDKERVFVARQSVTGAPKLERVDGADDARVFGSFGIATSHGRAESQSAPAIAPRGWIRSDGATWREDTLQPYLSLDHGTVVSAIGVASAEWARVGWGAAEAIPPETFERHARRPAPTSAEGLACTSSTPPSKAKAPVPARTHAPTPPRAEPFTATATSWTFRDAKGTRAWTVPAPSGAASPRLDHDDIGGAGVAIIVAGAGTWIARLESGGAARLERLELRKNERIRHVATAPREPIVWMTEAPGDIGRLWAWDTGMPRVVLDLVATRGLLLGAPRGGRVAIAERAYDFWSARIVSLAAPGSSTLPLDGWWVAPAGDGILPCADDTGAPIPAVDLHAWVAVDGAAPERWQVARAAMSSSGVCALELDDRMRGTIDALHARGISHTRGGPAPMTCHRATLPLEEHPTTKKAAH